MFLPVYGSKTNPEGGKAGLLLLAVHVAILRLSVDLLVAALVLSLLDWGLTLRLLLRLLLSDAKLLVDGLLELFAIQFLLVFQKEVVILHYFVFHMRQEAYLSSD